MNDLLNWLCHSGQSPVTASVLTYSSLSDSHSLTGIAKMVNYLKYQFSPVKSIYWWPTATDRVWTVADFDDAKFEG